MLNLTGYKLTFDDEFNTRSISQTGVGTTWADIRSQWRFDANSDIGFGHSSFVDSASGYDPFNVQGGTLSITAIPDKTASGYPGSWESGLITTQGNFSQTYGYFEMRADFSDAKGAWDAFWLLPDKAGANPDHLPGWQELDVVEHYGGNDKGVYSTIHTTDQTPNIPWQQNRQVYSEIAQPSGFHTYGMDWEANKISFYVDGQFVGSQATPSDMNGPMYVLANLATQSDADTASVPITTKIDYIRVYSNNPNAAAVRQDMVSAPDGHDPGLYGAATASLSDIHGTAGSDLIDAGQGGNHHLYGEAGDDNYVVHSQSDFIYEKTNEGYETVYADGTDYSLSLSAGGANVEALVVLSAGHVGGGSNYADLLIAAADRVQLFAGGGNDTLVAHGNGDILYGGVGDDIYVTTSRNVSIREAPDEGNDTIYADGIDFSLSDAPNVENLVLRGNNHVGAGTNGIDLLISQGVSNFLFGGGGDDTFSFTPSHGATQILDFDARPGEHDMAAFSTAQYANFAAVQSHLTQVGADAMITAADGSGDTFILKNVVAANLHASDFLFVQH